MELNLFYSLYHSNIYAIKTKFYKKNYYNFIYSLFKSILEADNDRDVFLEHFQGIFCKYLKMVLLQHVFSGTI